MKIVRSPLLASIYIFITFALPNLSEAHPLTFTATQLILHTDGTFTVNMTCDLDALALGRSQDTEDEQLVFALQQLNPNEFQNIIDRLETLFERRVRVRFSGNPEPFSVTFPDYGTAAALDADIPTVLGLTAQLRGTIPPDAKDVEFFASRSFSNVHLSVVNETNKTTIQTIIERGARSDPIELGDRIRDQSAISIQAKFFAMGLRHIIPDGTDHILFVLGLFLLSTAIKSLIIQITAFTVAHALTLAFATFGLINLPTIIIEPLIAISIAYIAIENIFLSRVTGRRAIVVFSFGLLHGLGFATILIELMLPPNELVLSLVSFNLGIEFGQLIVIGAAWLTIGQFRRRKWYRSRVVIPASVFIAVIAGVWIVERLS
tara:strand:- start:16929 stop:18056 length:1128 start_codon:yes stop_codon:yes gene_type:complete